MTKAIPVLILAAGLIWPASAAQVPPTITNRIRVRPCPDQQWQFETPSFAALRGARTFEGRYEGGVYRLEIPNDWNGELLLYVHGNRSNTGPEGSILRAPIAPGSGAGSVEWRQQEPLLTLHGTGDLQVPITVQRSIRRAVAAHGKEQWLVQRIMRIPGHCGFSDAEQIRAFDDLATWVRRGVRPDGDDVLQDFENAVLKFTDPLRPSDPGSVDIVP